MCRIGDVPDLVTVEAALDDVMVEESQIRVDALLELLGRFRERKQPHVPGGLARVVLAGAKTDARVRRGSAGCGRLLRDERRRGGGAHGERERRQQYAS
jgi:hypothetical protein